MFNQVIFFIFLYFFGQTLENTFLGVTPQTGCPSKMISAVLDLWLGHPYTVGTTASHILAIVAVSVRHTLEPYQNNAS